MTRCSPDNLVSLVFHKSTCFIRWYDRFNLNLSAVATNKSQSYNAGAEDERCNYIILAGIPWVNNTYKVHTSRNTDATVIASIFIGSAL